MPRKRQYEDSGEAQQKRRSVASNCADRIHPPADKARRQRCHRDFRQFCLSYFPEEFGLTFSSDHEKVIDKIERAVLRGELFALAMPRGSGKTTLAEKAVEWAILYGHRRFVALIGSDKDAAEQMLGSIQTDFETNDAIEADFAEVAGPFRALEGRAQRCASQHCDQKATHIRAKTDCFVMPTIEGSRVEQPGELTESSGAVIRAYGLTGRIRGARHKLDTGESIRPDLVIVDDPQTDATATSPTQNDTRESLLAGAVLRLAGPGKKIAGIMPCTVIARDDMADRILDRETHPEWQGERMKALYEWPTNLELWDEYAERRRAGLRSEDGGEAGNQFYLENREEMDAGARVAWEERVEDGDVSALQSLMNFYYQSEETFFAEAQNEPMEAATDQTNLKEEEVYATVRNYARGIVPGYATDMLTAAVDVHDDMLFYLVAGWNEKRFTGHVVEFGVWPEQPSQIIHQGRAKNPLSRAYPGKGKDAAIFAGLCDTLRKLSSMHWAAEDGASLSVRRLFVDSGYKPDTVFQAIMESADPRIVQPSRGHAIGARQKPFADIQRNKSKRERLGESWRETNVEKYNRLRRVFYDANHWKSFIRARIQTAQGDPGALSVHNLQGEIRQLYAAHMLAEKSCMVEANGRKVDEWANHPGVDNHWFDCLMMAAVAASVCGCELQNQGIPQKQRKKISSKKWFSKARG